jgi:hypothetical protein
MVLVVAAACSSHAAVEPQVTAVIGDTFQLRVGQQVSLDNQALRIAFESVPEDSRCPAQVTCVWAGNGRVGLRVTTGEQSANISLNTTLEPRTVEVRGYQISLERLDPHPVTTERVSPDRYVAQLKVTRP